MNRFISNWYHFWGHTMYLISDFRIFHINEREDTINYKIWFFFWNKYQIYILKAFDGESELYWWQKRYYG